MRPRGRARPRRRGRVIAPIAAGVLTEVRVTGARTGWSWDEEFRFIVRERGYMIALDGEREVRVDPGDEVTFTVAQRRTLARPAPRTALQRSGEAGNVQAQK